jgi:ParB family chromosome partitioning protein
MSKHSTAQKTDRPDQSIKGFQERRLGEIALRTYRRNIDIDELQPNALQPRSGDKTDARLQRQIEANQGVFEPLLVEPHPDNPEKYRIIDGERRWTNCAELVAEGKDQYRSIPVEVVDRTLTDEERLRVWVYIHRQRKEWSAREKESVAHQLVRHMGKAAAADILGTSVREVEKLVDTFALSTRFENLRDSSSAITWARELQGISKKLMTPEVVDAVVNKVSRHQITNSKEIRELRKILRDPIATDHFLNTDGDIRSALLCMTHNSTQTTESASNLAKDLDALTSAMSRHSWTTIEQLKGDPTVLQRIERAEGLLNNLKKMLQE